MGRNLKKKKKLLQDFSSPTRLCQTLFMEEYGKGEAFV